MALVNLWGKNTVSPGFLVGSIWVCGEHHTQRLDSFEVV